MTRIQQQVGKHGQKQAASYLAGMGLEMVEEIGTPVITLPVKHTPGYAHRKDIFRVIYGEKVSEEEGNCYYPSKTYYLDKLQHTIEGQMLSENEDALAGYVAQDFIDGIKYQSFP